MEQVFIYHPENAIVETESGKVRGYFWNGISIFKGIPYAKAKRFHAPQPVEHWEGVFDATSYGYVCPLLDPSQRPNGELLVPHRYWIMNEDCQNLNIWTPGLEQSALPVLVWLHGGGFEAGSAIEQVAYEGESMCREGNVVVVSINHRLNVLGYCDLSPFGEQYANSGNAGTDDIIAALRWVRDNIANFGGDPDNVTVFGQSGGGAKVTTLLQTPAADGLYAKGINMSGVIGPLLADGTGSGEELARAMMKELKLNDVSGLETVPYPMLAEAYQKVKWVLAKEGLYVGGTPYKNNFYAGSPAEHGFRKETSQIPMLVGTVYGEFTSFMPTPYNKSILTAAQGEEIVCQRIGMEAAQELLPLYKKAYPERNPVDLLNLDFIFRMPTMQYVRQRSALNQCTYSYLFNLDMPVDHGRTPWHCADIPYVFHNTNLVPSTQEKGVTEEVEKQIFGSVIAFARTGNPNHAALPEWSPSTPEEERIMVFDKQTRQRINYDEELIPLVSKYMWSIFARGMEQNKDSVQH